MGAPDIVRNAVLPTPGRSAPRSRRDHARALRLAWPSPSANFTRQHFQRNSLYRHVRWKGLVGPARGADSAKVAGSFTEGPGAPVRIVYENFVEWGYPCPKSFGHPMVRCLVFVSRLLVPLKMESIAARARLPAQNPAIAAARKHFPCGQVPVWNLVLPPEDDRATGACFFPATHLRRNIVTGGPQAASTEAARGCRSGRKNRNPASVDATASHRCAEKTFSRR